MKNLKLLVLLFVVMAACKDKNETIPDPNRFIVAPKADFTYTTGEFGELSIRFPVNHKDYYAIDLGNGVVVRDSISNPVLNGNLVASKTVRFAKNGDYIIKLTVANIKGVASSTQAVSISNIPPVPTAAFRYSLTADGIKLNNESKDYQTIEWHFGRKGGLMGYSSLSESPELKFDNNGLYYLNVRVTNKYGVFHEKRDSIQIDHIKNNVRPTFEGTFFDKSGLLTGESVNTFQTTWGPAALYGWSVQYFVLKDIGSIFLINGPLPDLSVETKRRFLKEKLKPGDAKKNNESISISKGKTVFEKNDGNINVKNDPESVFEVIEVTEAEQPRLFPEVHEKAYWVTYRIKADLGVKGKIDGKLKVRYLVY